MKKKTEDDDIELLKYFLVEVTILRNEVRSALEHLRNLGMKLAVLEFKINQIIEEKEKEGEKT